MENNVVSFFAALAEGFEPKDYVYAAGLVPEGEYDAVLDKKIWAKKALGIGCYFTIVGTGKKIQLTAFYRSQAGVYTLPGSKMNIACCATGQTYRIKVKVNVKNRVVFESAIML